MRAHGGRGAVDRLSAALRRAAPSAWFLEDEVAGLGEHVGPGAVCLDIGAEYGLYTWVLAGLVGASGEVHAVEPQPGPCRFIRTVGAGLRASRVSVHRLALGAEVGAGALSLPSRRGLPVHGRAFLTTGADGLGSNHEFPRHSEVPVSVSTVDDLVADLGLDRLDFVKVDIEGAEESLLAGAGATLARFAPTLMMELEDRHLARYGTDVASVVDRLAADGYRARCWERDAGWVPYRLGAPQRNVLFVRG